MGMPDTVAKRSLRSAGVGGRVAALLGLSGSAAIGDAPRLGSIGPSWGYFSTGAGVGMG